MPLHPSPLHPPFPLHPPSPSTLPSLSPPPSPSTPPPGEQAKAIAMAVPNIVQINTNKTESVLCNVSASMVL